VLVVLADVIPQELLEWMFRRVHALPQPRFAKDAEEAFDHVKPGGMCGWVVEVHVGMWSQPALGRLVFVKVEVVEDDVQLPVWERRNRVIHESQKVHGSAALFDVCHDVSARDLQSCQPGPGGVTGALVGPTPGLFGTQWQRRLGTVQRLDNGLCIAESTSACSGGFK
jgi:hypothetical protein